MDIEISGEEAEHQIDPQLCTEIHQNQRPKQRIRDSVHFPESGKQHRRQAEHRRHRKVRKIANKFRPFVICFFHRHRYAPTGHI